MTFINIASIDGNSTTIRRSVRSVDVSDKHVAQCAPGISLVAGGGAWQVWPNDSVYVRGKISGKYALLTIYSNDIPVMDIGFARHSLGARTAWDFVGGVSDIPSVPFLACQAYKDAELPIMIEYIKHLLAWALFDHLSAGGLQ